MYLINKSDVFIQKTRKVGKMVNFIFNRKNVVKNTNSGITLIALVITIIVLLILARNFYIYVKWRK